MIVKVKKKSFYDDIMILSKRSKGPPKRKTFSKEALEKAQVPFYVLESEVWQYG